MWVTTTLEPSPVGPPRPYYHLTDAGEIALRVFTETWRPAAPDLAR